MTYKPGDFLELPNGRSVRLNKDTAEIANAAVKAAAWNPDLENLDFDKLIDNEILLKKIAERNRQKYETP